MRDIVYWCDRCIINDVKTPATPRPAFSIDDGPRKAPHLCDDCDKHLFDELRSILPSFENADRDSFRCSLCPDVFESRQALNAHKRQSHPNGEYPCPVPTCDFVARSMPGLGTHKSKAHGIPGQFSPKPKQRVPAG